MEFEGRFDLYCERLGPDFWAEPVNAATNLAFVLAAIWSGLRLRGTGFALGWVLAALLGGIGVGSFLWHGFATGWAALTDVIPIALFILVFVFAVHRDMLLWPPWGAFGAAVAFVPYMSGAAWVFANLPFFTISAPYWPVVLALLVYARALRGRVPGAARGFAAGAAILSVSLIARSLDSAVCDHLPVGTHFLWHLLNAAMLAMMIDVYRRQRLAGLAGRD